MVMMEQRIHISHVIEGTDSLATGDRAKICPGEIPGGERKGIRQQHHYDKESDPVIERLSSPG